MDTKSAKHRLCTVPFARIYPYYVLKAKKKGRTKEEVDQIIRWLTGYTQKQFEVHLKRQTDFETFFGKAKLNPKRKLIKGVVCGIRVEEIKDPFVQKFRQLDKLIDDLAKGKELERIIPK